MTLLTRGNTTFCNLNSQSQFPFAAHTSCYQSESISFSKDDLRHFIIHQILSTELTEFKRPSKNQLFKVAKTAAH